MAPSARHYVGLWAEDALAEPLEERSVALRRNWWPAAMVSGALLGSVAILACFARRPAPHAGPADHVPFIELEAGDDLGPSGAAPPSNSFIVPIAAKPAEPSTPVTQTAPVVPAEPEGPIVPAEPIEEVPAVPAPAQPEPAALSPEEAPPAPAPPPAPGSCATDSENCWIKRCCENPKHICFMKDGNWAGCMESCTEGVHKQDPDFAQQPWNCYTVPLEGPAVPPAAAPHAPAPAAETHAAPAQSSRRHAPILTRADGNYPTLFCFEIIRTGTYELKVVQKQKQLGASIFGCETAVVVSDDPIDLGDGTSTLAVGDLSTGNGVRTHFANTDIFTRTFDILKEKGDILKHDFMVKVDPDAVFLPARLKEHIRTSVPQSEKSANVYFQNCFFQDKNWMFGAIEVLSLGALNAYYSGRDGKCRSQLDYDNMGEDTFLARCLDLLGVEAKQDFDLLSDGYCEEAPGDCRSGQVTYHPFKDPASWEACFKAASASR